MILVIFSVIIREEINILRSDNIDRKIFHHFRVFIQRKKVEQLFYGSEGLFFRALPDYKPDFTLLEQSNILLQKVISYHIN